MSLYEKIYNVMCDSAGLEKDLVVGSGSNSYKAVGEKEVLNMMKPLFKKYKLIIFPIDGDITEQNSIYDSTYKNEVTTKTRNVTQLKVKFKIIDIESNESEIITGFGNGADSQDKGSGKAFTYAFKTALNKTFMLFSGEDTDNTHSDDIGKPEVKSDIDKPKGNNTHPNKTEPPKTDSTDKAQPSELEKRATAIYFKCTGNKEGQLQMTKEAYKQMLQDYKDNESITNTYGKKWTLGDVEFLETEIENMDGLPL